VAMNPDGDGIWAPGTYISFVSWHADYTQSDYFNIYFVLINYYLAVMKQISD